MLPDFVVPALDLALEPVVRWTRLRNLFVVETNQSVILQVPLDHLILRNVPAFNGLELWLSHLPTSRTHPEPGGPLKVGDHCQVLGCALRVPGPAGLVNIKPFRVQPT